VVFEVLRAKLPHLPAGSWMRLEPMKPVFPAPPMQVL
jgi:hypothetical protein